MLSNVQVGDNLNAAFAGHALSALSVTATPNLTANPSYNGVSNTDRANYLKRLVKYYVR